MRVRLATIGDVKGLATIHVETWQTAYRGQVPDEYLDLLSLDNRISAWRRHVVVSDFKAARPGRRPPAARTT